MKCIVRSLMLAGAVTIASSVNADIFSDLNPFIGFDYQQTWMKGKESDADAKIFFNEGASPNSYPGANLYVGTKFMENLGVEAGFDWAISKKKNFSLTDIGSIVPMSAKVRRTGFHFDLIGFLPVADCTELFANVGVGFVKAKIVYTSESSVNDHSWSVKTKPVLRVGVGASYMITEIIGIRGKLGYETTSRLRVRDKDDGTPMKVFKDSQTISVGAFLKF